MNNESKRRKVAGSFDIRCRKHGSKQFGKKSDERRQVVRRRRQSKKNDVLLYMTLRKKRAWTDRVLKKNGILKTVTERSTEK